jgi:FKBP-type peptidyl-prolyl cis-trans isomerase (trigger factor)
VDRTLETIRKQRATWRPVEREAHLGDRVTIDFVGRLNGKEFEGGKATALLLVLGSGTLIESLERGWSAQKRRVAQRHGQVSGELLAILYWPGRRRI